MVLDYYIFKMEQVKEGSGRMDWNKLIHIGSHAL